ncbi:uncharacterized protein LOC144108745 [Amblyomma americanum]
MFDAETTLRSDAAWRKLNSLVRPDLLSCGDIEANPGPTEKEMLSELLAGQGKITSTMEGLQASQNKIEDKLSSLTERIDGIERQLSGLNVLATKVKDMESTISELQGQLTLVRNQMDDLENRGRRNNLIIYGIEEDSIESNHELEEKVTNGVFQEKLGLTVGGVERCHRMGKKEASKVRPVILKLLDFREKMSILQSCHKLKDSGISIAEDYSKRVREIRKQLWKSCKEERDEGAKAKLLFDKLSVDNVLFGWDEAKGSRFRLRKKSN